MSQGCEWHRGRAGCGSRREEDGVLQAEVEEGDKAGCSKPEKPYMGAEVGEGWGCKKATEGC